MCVRLCVMYVLVSGCEGVILRVCVCCVVCLYSLRVCVFCVVCLYVFVCLIDLMCAFACFFVV